MATNKDEVIKFQVEMKRFASVLNIGVAEAEQKLVLDGLTMLAERTPKDTGRAAASWDVSLDQPGDSVQPEGSRFSEEAAVTAAQQHGHGLVGELTANPYRVIWLFDNVPYIIPLEHGHSQQAPNGMAALTVADLGAEIDGILEAEARRAFNAVK